MKPAPLPTGTSQIEVKVTLRHRRQVNDTFSLTFDVEASDTAKKRYLRWIKLIGDRHTTAARWRTWAEE